MDPEPRTRRSRCSPPICATCCSPRRPAGAPTIGLDPGFRTGVKVAVVDATGKIVDTTAIYPHEPQRRWDESLAVLEALAVRHKAELVAIGNGTASRETDRLAADLLARNPELKLDQGHGVGGGRLRLFRLGLRRAGTAGPRRDAARRGLDRQAAAGPARRTRQDRPEVDRRRPVPARPLRAEARPLARRGGRGLRQRGRGRRQHGVGQAARATSRASARRWRRRSSSIARRMGPSRPARR